MEDRLGRGRKAGRDEISGLTSNLSSLEVDRVVDENPPDLKEYGLAQPRIEVAFKSSGQQHTLLIGQKTPPGTDLYAKRADDEGVPDPRISSTFNKSTFDFRDKAVMKVDRDKLDALEFTAGDRSSRFVRPAGGEWQIAAPVQARADFSAIEGLVSRLSGLQMKSIIDTPDGGSEEVWVRQTGRDREVRHRLFAGDARARGQGGRGHHLRATCHGQRFSPSNRLCSTS